MPIDSTQVLRRHPLEAVIDVPAAENGAAPETPGSAPAEVAAPTIAADRTLRRRVSRVLSGALLLVALAAGFVLWQEALSPMPAAGAIEPALAGTPYAARLSATAMSGHDVVLTYDFTGQPYFKDRAAYVAELRKAARGP